MRNKYKVTDNYVVIYLETGSGETYETYVDTTDLPLIQEYKWFYVQGYAKNNKGEPIHKLLMGTNRYTRVDHKDRDKLNNRRENLRRTDMEGNGSNVGIRKDNKTGIRGVSLRDNGRYRAGIRHKGQRINLGTYEDKYEAGRAVTRAQLEYFGTHGVHRTPIQLK
jgi:hypothetical protein